MKKLIAIIFSVLLALSVAGTAFAAEGGSTPDSVDLELQIKQDANEYFYNGKADLDDLFVIYYGELSDGSILLNIENQNYSMGLDVTYSYNLGNYCYYYQPYNRAYIYKDNTFYFLVDAYESGMISDEMLDELYNISVELVKDPSRYKYFLMDPLVDETTTQPVEEVTQIVEESTQVVEPTNSVSTSSTDAMEEMESGTTSTETKPVSTSDTAVADNASAVQTGQSSLVIAISFVVALAAGIIALTKCSYKQ